MNSTPPQSRHEDDHQLAERVLSGSETDWHDFIDQYSPLLRSVIRRYIHDDDDVRDVWVDILDRLRSGLLKQYAARSALSTWLVFVARSSACDYLRKRRGRRRVPDEIKQLSERHQFVYRNLYVLRRSAAEVRQILAQEGEYDDDVSLAETIAELEDALGKRTLDRLAWDIQADSVGAISGRLLEYLDHAAAESAAAQKELSPDRQLLHDDARQTLVRIHEIIASLPELERRVIELRYGRNLSAPEIAKELSLERPREVYTIASRAIRSVRKLYGTNMLLVFLIFLRAHG